MKTTYVFYGGCIGHAGLQFVNALQRREVVLRSCFIYTEIDAEGFLENMIHGFIGRFCIF